MKKLCIFLMLVLISSFAFANTYHGLGVIDDYGDRIDAADIVSIRVLIPNTDTNATIYTTKANSTAITQPITSSSTNTTLLRNTVYWWGGDIYDIEIKTSDGTTLTRRSVNGSQGSLIVPFGVDSAIDGVDIAFGSQPVCAQEDGTVSSGVDTEINVGIVGGGDIFEFINIGTQTVLVPNIVATGLDIARTGTDDIGTEYGLGILAVSPGTFTVGTSPAFSIRAKITITDVSGTDDFLIGFRKLEAYQAAVDNYDEMAAFNIISGAIYTETIINGAGTVSTDTTNTWADLATKTVQVNVSAAGVVTYQVNGLTPTTVVAYTFDDGEVVVPFIYFLNASDVAESTILQTLSVGLN